MLKVLVFYFEFKKYIRKYVLRVGYREYKCKVEERKVKKLYWIGEGEVEKGR